MLFFYFGEVIFMWKFLVGEWGKIVFCYWYFFSMDFYYMGSDF